MPQDFHKVLTGRMAPDTAVQDVKNFIPVAEAHVP
jgi:hypothetical protein